MHIYTVVQNWSPNYPIMSLSGLTGSVLVLHDLIGSAKADLYGQYFSVAIINFCAYMEGFPKSSNIIIIQLFGYNRERLYCVMIQQS